MKEFIAVFVGSGLGGVARFGLGRWIGGLHQHHFPFGTLTVNFLACLMLGFVIGLVDHRQVLSPTVRVFLTVGVCGGFSTFSTFSSESLMLFQQGHNVSLVFYLLCSVLLCVTATFGGLWIAERL